MTREDSRAANSFRNQTLARGFVGYRALLRGIAAVTVHCRIRMCPQQAILVNWILAFFW